jgi:hypothetical protein
MKIRTSISVIVLILLLLVAAAIWFLHGSTQLPAPPPPPLSNLAGAPIALLGTITAVGTDTITVSGQPAANTAPIVLELLITASTTLTEAAPPSYTPSSITFANLAVGMQANVTADAADSNGVRPAERVGITPAATSTVQ